MNAQCQIRVVKWKNRKVSGYLFALLEELLRGLPELLDKRLQVVNLLSGLGFQVSGLDCGVGIWG